MADVPARAELVIASDLRVIECDRVLIRATVLDERLESDVVDRQARLNAVLARWTLLGLNEEIIERARRPFPAEPVRTLDAIYLASAVLALDCRIRTAANRLGFPLVPPDAELGARKDPGGISLAV